MGPDSPEEGLGPDPLVHRAGGFGDHDGSDLLVTGGDFRHVGFNRVNARKH